MMMISASKSSGIALVGMLAPARDHIKVFSCWSVNALSRIGMSSASPTGNDQHCLSLTVPTVGSERPHRSSRR